MLNQVSTIGSFILAASMIPFFLNVYKSARGPLVIVDDPWGWGRSLEWATSCPPPRHNFVTIPRIRSESPAFDLHHPEVAAMELGESDPENSAVGVRRRRGARMKAEAWIFGSCAVFFLLVTPAYWFIAEDPTGTAALVMTTLLADAGRVLPRLPRLADGARGPRTASDAEIADGAGELGFFPPYSWWPLWCALTLAVMVFAVGDGRLVAVHHRRRVSAPSALSGWVFEYYVGEHAH